MRPPLVLWDIDGTLITTAQGRAGDLFARAVGEVLGRPVDAAVSDGAGMTDLEMLTKTFATGGVAPSPSELRDSLAVLDRLSTVDLYVAERRAVDSAIAAYYRLTVFGVHHGVVTGNSRARATAKLDAFGMADRFDFTTSAFGDESNARADVVALAVSRGGMEAVVCVGDTPADIRAATANALPSVVVPTGDFGMAELAAEGPTVLVGPGTDLVAGVLVALGSSVLEGADYALRDERGQLGTPSSTWADFAGSSRTEAERLDAVSHPAFPVERFIDELEEGESAWRGAKRGFRLAVLESLRSRITALVPAEGGLGLT